jgi:alkylation response protein AidB-like acyl-CoA dehydrogenase
VTSARSIMPSHTPSRVGRFGKPIAEFQGVQFELAQMAADMGAARLLVYNYVEQVEVSV